MYHWKIFKISCPLYNSNFLVLTEIDAYIIEQVKKLRKENNLTQIELSQKLEMSDSFISHVESSTKRAKYNTSHLNEIAKIFKCSPKDFWPDKGL